MELQPFAKLFNTAHGQLLYLLDQTDDEEPAINVIGAYVNDVQPQAKLSGWSDGEEGQLRTFNAVDQLQAEQTAAQLHFAALGMGGEVWFAKDDT
jgi:hypothetical protein